VATGVCVGYWCDALLKVGADVCALGRGVKGRRVLWVCFWAHCPLVVVDFLLRLFKCLSTSSHERQWMDRGRDRGKEGREEKGGREREEERRGVGEEGKRAGR